MSKTGCDGCGKRSWFLYMGEREGWFCGTCMNIWNRSQLPPIQQKQMTYFDYENQAWVVDGVYKKCGHPNCKTCFGTVHEGMEPSHRIRGRYEPNENSEDAATT